MRDVKYLFHEKKPWQELLHHGCIHFRTKVLPSARKPGSFMLVILNNIC